MDTLVLPMSCFAMPFYAEPRHAREVAAADACRYAYPTHGENIMRKLAIVVTVGLLAGCGSYQTHRNSATTYAATNASGVQVLYSPPQRSYESIGIVSAKHYKPGWTDPTVSDAIPELQAAGAAIGADAVIIRNDRSLNDRHVVVEGEAIRFTDAGRK